MTRDTERHIAKLRKTADEVAALPARGGDYSRASRLVFNLRSAANSAERTEELLVEAEKLIENYKAPV
jgi:hypothetical protein